MTDKDMVDRDVIKEKIPHAAFLICLFHVLKTFRREVTCDKMGIQPQQQDAVRGLLMKMCYANNLDEYNRLYENVEGMSHEHVKEYFDRNWHNIKEKWVDGLKNEHMNFHNRTNNRVECINKHLKAVILKYSTIVTFFRDLKLAVAKLETERKHRALTIFQKAPIVQLQSGSADS